MSDHILHFLGLARRAGSLAIGEEPVGAAARAKDARLLMLASDAAANTVRRAKHFADAGACIDITLPYTKDELGSAVGRTSCAMLALTDVGFADALLKKLAALDHARYGDASSRMSVKAQRAAQRRREAAQHEKNVRTGKAARKAREKKAAAVQEEKPVPETPQEKSPPQRERRTPQSKRPYRPRERTKRPSGAARFANSRPVKKGKGSAKKR